jgi:hypothetical protein
MSRREKIITGETVAYFPGDEPWVTARRNSADARGFLRDKSELAAQGATMTVRVLGTEYDVDQWVAYCNGEIDSVTPLVQGDAQ